MAKNDIDVMQIVTWLTEKVPGLHVNRTEFLHRAYRKILTESEADHLITNGPHGVVNVEQIDMVAAKQISKDRLTTTSVSVVAGLPSNPMSLAATIPVDIVQSFAFYIRIAQELAYLYGEDDLFDIDDEDTKVKLLLYIGAMFGVSKAADLLLVVGKNAGPLLAKKFGQVAVTKVLGGVPWKIAKTIATLLGVKLTKEIAQKGITKVVPVIGGVASGFVTYRAFGPMANRLKGTLHEAYVMSPEDIESKIDDLMAEDPDDIATSVSGDIIDGVIVDIDEIDDEATDTSSAEKD